MIHRSYKDITSKELKEVKELFAEARCRFKKLKSLDDIESVCNHINNYELIKDTYNNDVYTINIATDNTESGKLQGIRIYINKTYKPLKISKFIGVYFNDEEYPLEDVEI